VTKPDGIWSILTEEEKKQLIKLYNFLLPFYSYYINSHEYVRLFLRHYRKKENKMNTKQIWVSLIIVYGSIHSYEASAGYIRVINEKPNDLTIQIIPEPALTEKAALSKDIKGKAHAAQKNYADFYIAPEHINNKSHFAVAGATNFFLGDKCRNLSVLKHYEISFQDDPVGTTCVAEEVPETMFKY
jgi:hypothetical protein